MCDVFDGSVARHYGQQKRSGAFMDSVLDRVADAILFSCLFWALAEDGRRLDAALALFTLVVSLSVSHIRAEAEAAGVQLTEGLFQRLERFLALMIGLVVPGAMTPILVILAVLEPARRSSAAGPRSCGPRPMEFVRVASFAEIPEGEMRAFDLSSGASPSRTWRRGCSRSPTSAPTRVLALGGRLRRSGGDRRGACHGSVFDVETASRSTAPRRTRGRPPGPPGGRLGRGRRQPVPQGGG